MFGRIEAWSGYFQPLRDGPFKQASNQVLAANDPTRLAVSEASVLERKHTRFFISSGPAHSHWCRPSESVDFAASCTRSGCPPTLRLFPDRKGEWREQLDAGLAWAFGPTVRT